MRGSNQDITLKNTKLLNQIRVTCHGQILYYYELEYDNTSIVPHLVSVKKIAPNGDYLEASVAWASSQEGTNGSVTFGVNQKEQVLYADFNGDGKTDILSYNDNSTSATLNINTSSNNAVSYTSSIKTLNHKYKELYSLDLNGDGKYDIVGIYSSGLTTKVAYQLSNGTSFASNTNAYDASSTSVVLTGNPYLV